MLDALVRLAPTLERESLMGSAWKRLAQLEGLANQTTARQKALAQMVEHYTRAETLALQTGQVEVFYPSLNLLAADLLLHARDRRWRGLDAERTRRVRQSLERKRREDPDFWSVVGLPELGLYEALATQTLDTRLPGILQVLTELQGRIGTELLWASLADQLGFVLDHLHAADAHQARAATQLLVKLRTWAGAA